MRIIDQAKAYAEELELRIERAGSDGEAEDLALVLNQVLIFIEELEKGLRKE